MTPRLSIGATAFLSLVLIGGPTSAYDRAYPKAPIDEVEVLTLPASRWIASDVEGEYFDHSGTLFSRLFDFIKTNDIAMTVPVEGSLDRAEMRFHLGTDAPATIEGAGPVRVVEAASRRVVRIGAKGAYSEKNVAALRSRLETWLGANPEWQAAGPPYAVFWNGPFTPWFMKRFEVHIAVDPTAG